MAEDGDDLVEILDVDEETNEDVAPQEPPKLSQDSSAESNAICMICMEEWTIGSEHCICCLKCGHLFGRSCIERWYKEKGPANAKCPSCNKPYKKSDIRNIWCKTIRAADSTEYTDLLKQLEIERRNCANERAKSYSLKCDIERLYSEVDGLKAGIIQRDKKLAKLETFVSRVHKLQAEKLANNPEVSRIDTSNLDLEGIEMDTIEIVVDQQPKELKGSFYYSKNIQSHPHGGCKTFALCPTSAEILIAQPVPPNTPRLGNDFGIRKYSLLDTSLHSFIYLHAQALTSVQVKPFGDLILTSGQDRKIHLTSLNNSRKVQTYDCLNEPMHVSWSVHRDQQFYVASRNCYLALYDMRNTSEYIYQKNEKIARTTILSMTSIAQDDGLYGVVANDVRGSQFMEVSGESDYESEAINHEIDHLPKYSLPFSGRMGTVDYHKPTGTTLITTRQSDANPNAIHNLVKLKSATSEDGTKQIDCEAVRTFTGGATELLSHSRILSHPTLEGHALVGVCDDRTNGIKMWDASDNTEYQKLRTNQFVRDMVLHTPEGTNQHFLYTLYDKGFGIYRWDYV